MKESTKKLKEKYENAKAVLGSSGEHTFSQHGSIGTSCAIARDNYIKALETDLEESLLEVNFK